MVGSFGQLLSWASKRVGYLLLKEREEGIPIAHSFLGNFARWESLSFTGNRVGNRVGRHLSI